MALNRIQLQQIYTAVVVGAGSFGFPMMGRLSGVALGLSDDELLSGIINAGTVENMVMPLAIKLAGEKEFWTLPVEPMLSLSGKNELIRRSVAKSGDRSDVRGTVKERWSTGDYTLQIIGQLRNWDDEYAYPRADVERLRYYCEARAAIQVQCPLLEIFNITQIAVESYEIPFTKGEDMQAYSITAYSDALFDLLIEGE